MEIDLKELAEFLIRAKINSWVADAKEIAPQRPEFKEPEPYIKGDLEYRDSYSGYYRAPGQEVVRFKGIPIWLMSYDGGMSPEYYGNEEFAKQIFTFLKKALMSVKTSKPYRGDHLKEGDYEYVDQNEGDITNFSGTERIFYQGKEVFRQNYIGGIIIHKRIPIEIR